MRLMQQCISLIFYGCLRLAIRKALFRAMNERDEKPVIHLIRHACGATPSPSGNAVNLRKKEGKPGVEDQNFPKYQIIY